MQASEQVLETQEFAVRLVALAEIHPGDLARDARHHLERDLATVAHGFRGLVGQLDALACRLHRCRSRDEGACEQRRSQRAPGAERSGGLLRAGREMLGFVAQVEVVADELDRERALDPDPQTALPACPHGARLSQQRHRGGRARRHEELREAERSHREQLRIACAARDGRRVVENSPRAFGATGALVRPARAHQELGAATRIRSRQEFQCAERALVVVGCVGIRGDAAREVAGPLRVVDRL